MKIAVTGSTGLVGSALVSALRARGDDVVRLVRRSAGASDEATWDPRSGIADPTRLEGLDAVVHLAGENIAARRWSDAQKERIRASRTAGTAALAGRVEHDRGRGEVAVEAAPVQRVGVRCAERERAVALGALVGRAVVADGLVGGDPLDGVRQVVARRERGIAEREQPRHQSRRSLR